MCVEEVYGLTEGAFDAQGLVDVAHSTMDEGKVASLRGT